MSTQQPETFDWTGDIYAVKTRIRTMLDKAIKDQRTAASDAMHQGEDESQKAYEHAAGIVEFIRIKLFGERKDDA